MKVEPTVLIADDDLDFKCEAQAAFKKRGFHVRLASSGEQAVKQVSANNIDVIVMDLVFKRDKKKRLDFSKWQSDGMDGIKTLEQIQSHDKQLPAFIVTSYKAKERVWKERVRKTGVEVQNWFFKPIEDMSVLVKTIEKCSDMHKRLLRTIEEEASKLSGRIAVGVEPTIMSPPLSQVILDIEVPLTGLFEAFDDLETRRELFQTLKAASNKLWKACRTSSQERKSIALLFNMVIIPLSSAKLLKKHLRALRLLLEFLSESKLSTDSLVSSYDQLEALGLEILPSLDALGDTPMHLYKLQEDMECEDA